MISITVIYPETLYIENSRIQSPIYLYVIDLIVSLHIRSGTGLFINVSVLGFHALNNSIFGFSKVYYSNTIIFTILMQSLIPNCHFDKSPVQYFSLIFPNRILIW